jgi:hypothetical protein
LPADFAISERVRTWAEAKGFTRLDEHLEAFRLKASARAYTYANWDDAFMGAIRDDWAKLRIASAPAANDFGARASKASLSTVRGQITGKDYGEGSSDADVDRLLGEAA